MGFSVERLPDGRHRVYDEDRSGIEGVGATQAEAVSKAQEAYAKRRELEKRLRHREEAAKDVQGIGRIRTRALLLSEIKSLHNVTYMEGVRRYRKEQGLEDAKQAIARLRSRRRTIWTLLKLDRFLSALSSVPSEEKAKRIIYDVRNIIEGAPSPQDAPLIAEGVERRKSDRKEIEQLRNRLFMILDETSKAFRISPDVRKWIPALEHKEYAYYFEQTQRDIEILKRDFEEALRIQAQNKILSEQTFLGCYISSDGYYRQLPNGIWNMFRRRGRASSPEGAIRATLCRLLDAALPDCLERYALIAELATISGVPTDPKQARSICR